MKNLFRLFWRSRRCSFHRESVILYLSNFVCGDFDYGKKKRAIEDMA
jgi:hypothetical protein